MLMIGLIIAILRVYELIIIVRAVVSWVNPNPDNPLLVFIYKVTEPVLAPFRQWTVFGGIDFSPLAVLLVIQIIISLLGRAV
jgi:YggT family protein